MQMVPDIYQLRVPIPRSSLGFLNAYLIRSQDGCVLVDAGWDAPESFLSLVQQLNELDVQLTDIRTIVITHFHPDHYGLAGRIRELSGAEIVVHHGERSFVESRYRGPQELITEMSAWLGTNGVPAADRDRFAEANTGVQDYIRPVLPDRFVSGGEVIRGGELSFQVIWTPGHTVGHMCLYEPSRRVLLAGDHVLPGITPIVSLYLPTMGNPLADFLNSLRAVSRLPVDVVLPAHQWVFHDLPKRVREILDHHDVRIERMREAIGARPHTAYEIAGHVPWKTPVDDWNDFLDFEKKATIFETLAHLEYMYGEHQVEKSCRNGLIYWGPVTMSQTRLSARTAKGDQG